MAQLRDNSTRSLQIVSGSATTTFTHPNTFTYRFPASGYQAGKDEVALKSLTIYFSWPNVSFAKGNNSFSYKVNGVEFPVVMADGMWSYQDVESYMHQIMRKNGHFLMDNGNPVYFIKMVANAVLYCISLTVDPVPPLGKMTNPANLDLSSQFQLVVPKGFDVFTGFDQGMYPPLPQATKYQTNSGIPQNSDATSLNVLCNLVSNSGFSLNTRILTSFVVTPNTEPGQLIQIQDNNLEWMPISGSVPFQEVVLEIVDQQNRPIILRDPSGFVAILNLHRRL